MSEKAVIKKVFAHMKKGNIIGTRPVAENVIKIDSKATYSGDSQILKYRSYNSALTKNNFLEILPESTFIPPDRVKLINSIGKNFDLAKMRDHRYFHFKDNYLLLFKDQKSLRYYYENTKASRINKAKVRFEVVNKDMDAVSNSYRRYVNNLLAAYNSGGLYGAAIKCETLHFGSKMDGMNLLDLQSLIKPVEAKSALVWNLPDKQSSDEVMDRFWFYDIKHCFKLYFDPDLKYKTLYYMAFNNEAECERFKRNFHGAYITENDIGSKVLIERLT
ncbi:hypothetical protein Kpol_1050p54 [Vanderwaltozyma polyspora DSM 70294]|uniref:Uncharacterized protein n=1 Tax=Vanderwaltozyma polyspora (strain ATCC 22028 / DSM 70294 / BCRC 21397 / CBS 2163 / NBRC 10782 / NRRL Y-8283 / UCD 57-17) TaxID=436907 RepID=A7TEV1_VANPO|nr:uncharacterized protein Kpol_1050p54 [Vanderwaltozyma polyspora DSM 70294]EDO19197.1 hypothetical protein Kpol_1050p54 [Vanderwaltozyma polyspora DSM 70294]